MNESLRSEVRAFKVLELLDERRTPLRLKDCCEALAAPVSSVADLLKSMTEAGYLAFDVKTRTYLPTTRVTSLADWVPTALFRQEEILDAMRRLSRKCGELIFLGTASDIHVIYAETIPSTLTIQMVVERGARRMLVQSGMGWALLSGQTDATVEKVYRRTAQLRQVDRTKLPLEKVLARVKEVRKNGFVYSRDTVFTGAGVIATRLPWVQHDRHLALGIAGPTSRLDENLPVLRRALMTEAAKVE